MRMFWRLYVGAFIAVLIVVSALSYFLTSGELSDAERHVVDENRIMVDLVAPQLEAGITQNRWPFESLNKIAQSDDFLFWWIVKDDATIYLADRVSMIGTRTEQYFPQIGLTESTGEAILNQRENYGVYVYPLTAGKKKWSFWLGFSLTRLMAIKRHTLLTSLAVHASAMVIIGLVLYYLISHYNRPLKHLAEAAAIIGTGDFTERVSADSRGELGELAQSFNAMASNLQQTTIAKKDMEIQVQERTAELKESRDRYQKLVENTRDWVWEIDEKGVYTYVSPRLRDILGYESQQVLNKTPFDLMDHDEAKRVYEIFATLSACGEPLVGLEATKIHRDGRRVVVESNASPFFSSDGALAGFRGISRDITERKRTEEKLRESEARFRLITEAMVDIVWTTDLNFRTTYVSPSVVHLLGFTPEERKQQTIEQQITPESLVSIRQLLAEELQKETYGTADPDRSITVLAEHYRGDGSTIWLENKVRGLRDSQGTLVGIHGLSRDVSDRIRMEKEKEALQAQLLQSQKMETIGTLAAGIAHDFNNMLTVILGYSSMLLSGKHEGDPEYKGLKAIVKTSEDAAELVQRIRVFSKKADLKLVHLNLNHEIEGVIKILNRTLLKTIDTDIHLAEPLATIHADRNQMVQLVMNLAINAGEAMPQGGSLTIQTENISLDDGYCRLHVGVIPGQYVMLRVADTGRGIEQGLIDRIFDPFYSTKPRDFNKGTGLGLSVVQGIVELHSGHITVESEVGQGTTFKIYFAAVEPEKIPEAVEKKTEIPDGGNETILLVEDEELVRELGVRILERFGFTVLSAGDGQEAVDVYKKRQANIALVILDVVMPKMDGKQCLMELLTIDPAVKVIVSSGLDPEGLVKEIVTLGAKGSVNKPYSMKQMIQKVREVLDGD